MIFGSLQITSKKITFKQHNTHSVSTINNNVVTHTPWHWCVSQPWHDPQSSDVVRASSWFRRGWQPCRVHQETTTNTRQQQCVPCDLTHIEQVVNGGVTQTVPRLLACWITTTYWTIKLRWTTISILSIINVFFYVGVFTVEKNHVNEKNQVIFDDLHCFKSWICLNTVFFKKNKN